MENNAVVFIPLTQGKVALVDDVDYAHLIAFNWYAKKDRANNYAAYVHRPGSGIRGRKLLMHRLVMGAKPGEQVDHKNGNTLDNRRGNLRLCSNAENQRAFKRKRLTVTSKFRGVCWCEGRQKWIAQIKLNGKHFNLGRFSSEEDAARAYDAKARELFGEYASPNFPQ